MNLILHVRNFLFDHPTSQADRLRRAGYCDGERRPKRQRHWTNS